MNTRKPDKRKDSIGKRNLTIAVNYLVILILILAGLKSYSLEPDPEPGISLESMQDDYGLANSQLDPLAISYPGSVFQFLAVNDEKSVIGYASDLSTGQAAARFIELLEGRGWLCYNMLEDSEALDQASKIPDDMPMLDQSEVSSSLASIKLLTGPFALMLSYKAGSDANTWQMMAQFFPSDASCSLVVALF
ncbi:MAG: hypothetical protein FWH40_02235 [Coriobacteriia bacterium]|nr:hypothetical protein [Coriobacteriia bacterium]